MKFVKMHGLGNDYVYIDCFRNPAPEDPSALSVAMSLPHFGIGADGLVLILPSEAADCRMRMFNKDGSEGDMCGNAIRCVGKYMHDTGLISGDRLTVETRSGIKALALTVQDGVCTHARVDMGAPSFDPARIPVDAPDHHVTIDLPDGERLRFTCVNVGNPHAVTFDLYPEDERFYRYGPYLERHPLFPNRANIEFARVNGAGDVDMRVWERGSGETMACGTGATATLVAAASDGLCDRKADVHLPGGTLTIEWDAATNHVFMTGPATVSFTGEWTDALAGWACSQR